jgi:hypothetical protein
MSARERQDAHIFIAKGHTQRWKFTWHEGEWHGDTIAQPKPLANRASLTYASGSFSVNGDGICSLFWSVANQGPDSTFFSVQPTNY